MEIKMQPIVKSAASIFLCSLYICMFQKLFLILKPEISITVESNTAGGNISVWL